VSTLLGFGAPYRGVDFCEKLRRVVLLRKDVSPRGHPPWRLQEPGRT
jgi:hypothetical protein